MIIRFMLLIFISGQTGLPVLRHIMTMGGSLLRWAVIITPHWLNARSHDLYLALLLFLARYYALPALASYEVRLVVDLPMEAKLASLASGLVSLF